MFVITLIVYCMFREGASTDEVPADTVECRGDTAVRTVRGGSGGNVIRIPQTETQEVRSVL